MLRVFTFAPNWGLPTTGPFAIKLLAWLELAGIPYEQVIEEDPRKGPKGKSPWVELDGQRIGDSEVIIDRLSARHKFDLDAGLTPADRAIALAWRRTFEEHFHQVLEWELLIHPAGVAFMRERITPLAPPGLAPLVLSMLRRHFRKQLYARGVSRHAPDVIAAMGRADIDALAAFLGDRRFLVADRPTSGDLAVYGLIAPCVHWPMKTPVAQYARTVPAITAYCDRIYAACFSKRDATPARAAA